MRLTERDSRREGNELQAGSLLQGLKLWVREYNLPSILLFVLSQRRLDPRTLFNVYDRAGSNIYYCYNEDVAVVIINSDLSQPGS